MPLKASDAAEEPRMIDRWDDGFGWIAHPEEGMQRASHAFRAGDEVWVVDPVDAAGVDAHLAELGEVAGVVVLIDRHSRDAAEIANRHDVAVSVPSWMAGVADELDAPVERFSNELAGTGYRIRQIVDLPFWREAALLADAGETLVVADALGTADYFLAGEERLGVSPALRLFPPHRTLGDLSPKRILVGHGEGVLNDAAGALEEALATARRRAPRAYVDALASFLP